MARPTNASLEAGDPFGTREGVRLIRKHMRRADAALARVPVGSEKCTPLIELLLRLTAELRAVELHTADLIRNPPRRAGAGGRNGG
jgi:hypothetical protein